jgi:hypothetical protein
MAYECFDVDLQSHFHMSDRVLSLPWDPYKLPGHCGDVSPEEFQNPFVVGSFHQEVLAFLMANAPRGARSTLKLNAATAKTLIKNAIEDWGYPNSPFRVKALKTALHRGSLTQLDSDPDTLCAKLVFSKAEVVVEQMPEPVKQGEATNMDQLSGKKASADEECGVSAGEQSMGPVTSEDATNMVSADSIGGEIIIELLLRNLVKHVPTFGRNMSLGRGSNRENLPLLLLVEKLRCGDSFAADNRDQMSWVLPYFLEWTRVSASGKETMVGPLLKCVILQVEQQLREVTFSYRQRCRWRIFRCR